MVSEGLGLGLGDGEAEGPGLGLGLWLGDPEGLGETDGLGEGEADGEGLGDGEGPGVGMNNSPQPNMLSFPAEPRSSAVDSRRLCSVDAFRDGSWPRSKAAAPPTCGVDAEVPANPLKHELDGP